MIRVAITGGIGSGKSTLSRLFAAKGIPVYDSDAAAKRLMAVELRKAVETRFGAGAYRDGELDRAFLAGIVFRDRQALADLNAIVHPAVKRDFEAWAAAQEADYVILESAVLFEAGFENAVDRVVAVLAPAELRVERTCRRDKSDADAVRRRIAAQTDDDTLARRADFTVVNILEAELSDAVTELDKRFRHEARNSDR